jgi:hypothetical protein
MFTNFLNKTNGQTSITETGECLYLATEGVVASHLDEPVNLAAGPGDMTWQSFLLEYK